MTIPTFIIDADDIERESKRFKYTCALVLKTPLYKALSEEERLTQILIWLGPDFGDEYESWTVGTKSPIEEFWTKFTSTYVAHVPHLTYRYNLRCVIQDHEENIATYVKRLEQHVAKCKYTSTDEHTLEQLLHRTHTTEAREDVLDSDDTSL